MSGETSAGSVGERVEGEVGGEEVGSPGMEPWYDPSGKWGVW